MEVRLYPNSTRPGVGLRPRREAQRPLLPQHSRHCPVLEAGSAVGYLVYPPLEDGEAFHIGYQGEGKYRFVYYVNPSGQKWEGVFAVTIAFPVGGVGIFREDVTFLTRVPTTSRENALLMARTFVMPENLGTPPGGLSLRGAWNFQTPSGWDTLYTPVFNMIERPLAPMLVVRVETDWYAHETEFRYVLQPGEGISGDRHMPIGQVLFVPREEITMRDCTDEELAALKTSAEAFSHDKAATKLTTPYGLPYSPHYARTSRSVNADLPSAGTAPRPVTIQRLEPAPAAPGVSSQQPVPKAGRNDPCPCGSGKKYKQCHGA